MATAGLHATLKMCGRFTQHADSKALAKAFVAEFVEPPDTYAPRYNITPGTPVMTVQAIPTREGTGRVVKPSLWGLVPPWQESSGRGLANARVESLTERPSFREAFKRRRCLIPANGFFEWDRRYQPRRPFYFSPSGSEWLAMAGIWEGSSGKDGSHFESVAIITSAAVDPVASIHDRMPLFISASDWNAWLSDGESIDLSRLIMAGREVVLEKRPVSLAVNDARSEGPSLIVPLDGPSGAHLQGDLFDL